MKIDVENFNINSIPGFTSALKQHLQRALDDMASRDGDEWQILVALRLKPEASTIRAEVKLKPPKPEVCSWVSKAVRVGK